MRKRLCLTILVLLTVFAGARATVTTQNNSVSFTCTGSTGPYPFTFPISAANALTVTESGTMLSPTAYTILPVNNNYANGGHVTLNSACLSGQALVLQRCTPLTQLMVFTDNMPIPYKTFERGLDKLTEIDQEIQAGVCGWTGGGGGGGGGGVHWNQILDPLNFAAINMQTFSTTFTNGGDWTQYAPDFNYLGVGASASYVLLDMGTGANDGVLTVGIDGPGTFMFSGPLLTMTTDLTGNHGASSTTIIDGSGDLSYQGALTETTNDPTGNHTASLTDTVDGPGAYYYNGSIVTTTTDQLGMHLAGEVRAIDGSEYISAVTGITLDAGSGYNVLVNQSLNAVTGFQYNSTAPLGDCLVGDGTNFIPASCGTGGMSIGGAISGSTPSPLLYVDASGNLGQVPGSAVSPGGVVYLNPTPLATPATLGVAPQTPGGGKTYTYKLVSCFYQNCTAGSVGTTTVDGEDDLTVASQGNALGWPVQTGATLCKVYRSTAGGSVTNTTGLIQIVTPCGTGYTDTGAAGDGSTAPTFDSSAGFQVSNFIRASAYSFDLGTGLSVGQFTATFGFGSNVYDNSAMVIGNSGDARAVNAMSFGYSDDAVSIDSSAFGNRNISTGLRSSAFGHANTITADEASAFGNGNTATGTYCSAFGQGTLCSADHASAFGPGSYATASYATAIGPSAAATTPNTIVIGSPGYPTTFGDAVYAPSFNGTGTGASISTNTASNTDLAGVMTASTNTATYTFAGTYVSPPVCVVNNDTAITAGLLTKTVTNTTLTVTTAGASDLVSYHCIGLD
jgi:hypothetical protein